MNDKTLIMEAFKARESSYSPYSNFMVGAALLAKNGTVYHGCNIENAAYTPTNCAERTAFFKAVSDGIYDFTAIAVVGAPKGTKPEDFGYAYPCGVCRQVMMEFCSPTDFRIITAKSTDEYIACTLEEMLPHGFGPNDLNK